MGELLRCWEDLQTKPGRLFLFVSSLYAMLITSCREHIPQTVVLFLKRKFGEL